MAKKRKWIWDISLEEYKINIYEKLCTYCGISLKYFTGHCMDKINPNLGYKVTNVLPCCGECNTIKNNILTIEETKEVIQLIKKLRKVEGSPWEKRRQEIVKRILT